MVEHEHQRLARTLEGLSDFTEYEHIRTDLKRATELLRLLQPANDPDIPADLGTHEGLLGSQWRHNKRGGLYRVQGFATLQASNGPVYEDAVLLVYRSLKDHANWARTLEEFLDGRFTQE